MPFLLGSALVYVLLSRERSPRIAYAAGILLGTGLVGLSVVQGYETTQFGLAQDGRFELATLADAIDDLTRPPAGGRLDRRYVAQPWLAYPHIAPGALYLLLGTGPVRLSVS